ncbi:MAG: hypothetical protein VXX08_02880 [Pseudomonadota bacterium]|nr:hypothetical protein [Pseudomonadota bacterium]
MRIFKNCALYYQLRFTRGYDDQHTSEKQPVANDKARSLVDLACFARETCGKSKVSPKRQRVDMRVLLLYLLPLLLLVASLFVIGQRRQGESQPQDEETSNASVFLKILAIGGCVAVALLLAIELN